MTMKTRTNTIIIYILQTFAWAWMILTPLIIQYMMIGKVRMGAVQSMLPLFFLYMLNFYPLIPKTLFSSRKGMRKWFFIINAAILTVWYIIRHRAMGHMIPTDMPYGIPPFFQSRKFASLVFFREATSVLVQLVVISAAVGVRHIIRTNDLQIQMAQERRDAAEAEISWLKNQINPHFLFNTLNNISSLTAIDAEKAQESIGQLSDLLRYALYESDSEKVSMSGEMEFMTNYVELMKLRCNDLTTVSCTFDMGQSDFQIAPLLFISLIENAFKHGVNSRKESFVNISMITDGEDVVFSCRNSVFEKQTTDRIGSGIGLENMKRRLDLIYPESYVYEVSSDKNVYSSTVRIKGIVK